MHILKGGISTGLRNVASVPSDESPRLVQFKGKIAVQSAEVPALAKSLNHGDAFVLDAGSTVFVWRGSSSKHTERFAAAQYAENVRSSRGKVTLVTLDDDGSEPFWKLLAGSHKDVLDAEMGGDDALGIKSQSQERKLFRLMYSEGTLSIVKVAEGPEIGIAEFKSEDVFLFDTGVMLFVWVGEKTDKEERRLCMSRAVQYLHQAKMGNVPIARILEGHETDAFKNALTKK